MYTGAASKDTAHALIDAMERFHSFKQLGWMDNATYLWTFQSHIEVIDHLSGVFGMHIPYIQTKIQNAGGDPDNVVLWSQTQNEVKEEFVAKYLLLNSDPKRYAGLIASIQNDFISGQDKYPKTLIKAYDMIVNYVNAHKLGGVDLQEQGMSFYQDDDNEHQRRGRGCGIPRRGPGRGPGQGCGSCGPGRHQCCGTPGTQTEDNEEDNYHLEEEYEQVIGGMANTDSHHSERLYLVIPSASNVITPHCHLTSTSTTGNSAHAHQYNLLQVSMNICDAEELVLEHHGLPTTWLLLDSCSTVDTVSNANLLHDLH
jgi:hypothetical protein